MSAQCDFLFEFYKASNLSSDRLSTSGWKTPLSNYIVLDWVPRYLVLDKDGNVIVPKAIAADDKVLERKLLE